MTLEAIKYHNGKLQILDQLLLPTKLQYLAIEGVEDGWKAINTMQVRGAPAIAIVGSLSLAVELLKDNFTSKKVLRQEIEGKLNYLISARPTAVNMKTAAQSLIALANKLDADPSADVDSMRSRFVAVIEQMLDDDINDNKSIGHYGAISIINQSLLSDGDSPNNNGNSDKITVLTHCNTGSLATAGYGTALGVIRALNKRKKIERVYFTETRPYNQGARLTAYELAHENIPAILICDSAVSALMNTRRISAVIVGADRITANGDTANKIGTYQIAVAAKYHGVPFYVAAPLTTIDLSLPSGEHIVIEERPDKEMTYIAGSRIAAPGISCWNPAFDVTPANLITGGIITNKGVFATSELAEKIKQINAATP
ncbi:methylthioribose-1-phosphate isomerase [Lycorma delicatula]|uniref:methylthioribose-1-phosphate isomerase n=1 Tax=Lycorma delicatula TaxID=130591 RepID=UPI003F50F425